MAVERVSPGDLMQLASDVGPAAMNIGAVLRLGPGCDVESARGALVARAAAIPRLGQRMVRVPHGLGRPIWIDDPTFSAAAQVSRRACPGRGDSEALLQLATAIVTEPLPRDRPLWRAVLVTGLADGSVALVLAMHHVLADGMGGLAVLAGLADGLADGFADGLADGFADGLADGSADAPAPGRSAAPAVRPAPSRRELLADRAAAWRGALRAAPDGLLRLRQARSELGTVPSAPRCSLNAPTGSRRRVDPVDVDLAAVRAAARRHGATVNDVLLVTSTAALQTVLAHRGEHPDHLVVSVPISARASAGAGELGNQVGVMPVAVPLSGSLPERLTRVAADTAARRGATRGTSAALVGPAFRGLARLGALHWFVDRQRLVNTFLTNLRGPAEPLSLGGATIRSIAPITTTAGNVTTSFAALSYAGTLTISVITDPERVPDHGGITAALVQHLHELGV